jgi:antitoxin component YwqK of YwqJK toxin-antitoxin module
MSNKVYKSCGKEWIIVLEKLIDTITNETRDSVVDKKYSKYRANKLKVLEIKNKYSDEKISELENSVYEEKKLIYKVGEIVEVDDYDNFEYNICAPGIHYFLNEECAYYYEVGDNYTGDYHEWNEDGTKFIECFYKNGKKDGKYTEFFRSGQIKKDCSYKNDELDGKYIEYHFGKGNKKIECEYKNGKLNGEYHYYNFSYNEYYNYENGVLHGKFHYSDQYSNVEGEYVNGLGKAIYFSNGKKIVEIEYKDKLLHGLWIKYDFNGNKIEEGEYKDNLLHGLWFKYDSNGNKTEESKYEFRDNFLHWLRINYDLNGNKTEESKFKNDFLELRIRYNSNGIIIFREEYNNNFLKKQTRYNSNGEKIEELECLEDGYFTLHTIYHQDNTVAVTKYIYKEDGTKDILMSWYKDGKLTQEHNKISDESIITKYGLNEKKTEEWKVKNSIYGIFTEYDSNGEIIRTEDYMIDYNGKKKNYNGKKNYNSKKKNNHVMCA